MSDTPKSDQQQFPCEQCGAEIAFAPGIKALKCPYCNHTTEIPESDEKIEELDFYETLANLSSSADLESEQMIKCQACGAESTLDPNITSDECPFCGSNIVVESSEVERIKPKSLLPFKITRERGRQAFRDWLKSLWFAPNKIKRHSGTHEPLQGMYIPYWTYDSDTLSHYTGARGDAYYVTESYTTTENGKSVTKTRQVRKIRWTNVSGSVHEFFDDVLIVASHSLPRDIVDKLEPWDLKNLVPYDNQYLSGFRAENYQTSLSEGFGQAKIIMDEGIRRSIRRDIGGDEQRIYTVNTKYDDITFKHLLLPIWISAYRYGEKVYRFLINGRTGEVQGERPWSIWKIALAIIAGLGVIGLLYYLNTVMGS